MNKIKSFKKTIWDYYTKNKRSFPWRETSDPYKILVSELMLQQTQTERVVPKYLSFLQKFPDFLSLSNASIPELLTLWSGLGYNRRALYLYKTAQRVVSDFAGKLPTTENQLLLLPGIGKYTAGAIMAFAYDTQSIFIETNIRRVYLHFFFPNEEKVSDKEIIKLVEQTLPQKDFRNWYYALMDYGVYLAKNGQNANTRSSHYTKQSKFEGSRRQIRGMALKIYLTEKNVDVSHMLFADKNPELVKEIINELKDEGFISTHTIGNKSD
jgi:A/G-specific adenine glycosylase